MTVTATRRRGRPRALDDPKIRDCILALVEAGNFPGTAAMIAGISRSAFKAWKRESKSNDPRAAHYRAFFGHLIKAEALSEFAALRVIRKGGPDWEAAAFWLSRRFPERWGRPGRARRRDDELDQDDS